jgi:DNA-directed RNA polymerase subunit RPC12/RpoP
MTSSYKCAVCGGTFDFVTDATWSEEQAKAEYYANFPNSSWETREVVCDDCWEKAKPTSPVYE